MNSIPSPDYKSISSFPGFQVPSASSNTSSLSTPPLPPIEKKVERWKGRITNKSGPEYFQASTLPTGKALLRQQMLDQLNSKYAVTTLGSSQGKQVVAEFDGHGTLTRYWHIPDWL